MAKKDRIPTMVRLDPKVHEGWKQLAESKNTSLNSILSSVLENPNTVQNVTIYKDVTINNNYCSEKKDAFSSNNIADTNYSIL